MPRAPRRSHLPAPPAPSTYNNNLAAAAADDDEEKDTASRVAAVLADLALEGGFPAAVLDEAIIVRDVGWLPRRYRRREQGTSEGGGGGDASALFWDGARGVDAVVR
jgi:hypothetical protein